MQSSGYLMTLMPRALPCIFQYVARLGCVHRGVSIEARQNPASSSKEACTL